MCDLIDELKRREARWQKTCDQMIADSPVKPVPAETEEALRNTLDGRIIAVLEAAEVRIAELEAKGVHPSVTENMIETAYFTCNETAGHRDAITRETMKRALEAALSAAPRLKSETPPVSAISDGGEKP